MTPQEKLELARDWYNDKLTTNKEKLLLENLFPELKEYNDEMIRKEMIDFIQETIDTVGESPNVWTMSNAKKWLAWLEKQGKQKTDEWKDDDIIRRGDVIKYGDILALVIKGRRAMKSNGEIFIVQYPDEWVKAKPNETEHFLNELVKQGEQNSAWSEEDERIRKNCIHFLELQKEHHAATFEIEECIAWLEKQNKETPKVITDSESDKIKKNIKIALMSMEDNLSVFYSTHHTSQKELLAWLEKQGEKKYTSKHKIGDTIYYNSFGKVRSMIVANVVTDDTDNPMYEDENGDAVFEKDLVEQNPTWSEEDEEMMQCIHKYIKASASNFDYQNIQIWFRNLKNRVQPHWKPTNKQMNLLREVQQALMGKDCHNRFVNFMYDLKKL